MLTSLSRLNPAFGCNTTQRKLSVPLAGKAVSDSICFSGNSNDPSAQDVLNRMERAKNWRVRATEPINYANPRYEFEIDGVNYGLYTADHGNGVEYYLQQEGDGIGYLSQPSTRVSAEMYDLLVGHCQKAFGAIEDHFGFKPDGDVTGFIKTVSADMLSVLANTEQAFKSGSAGRGDFKLGGYCPGDFHHQVKTDGDRFTLALPDLDGQIRNLSIWPEYQGSDVIEGYKIRLYDGDQGREHAAKTAYTFKTSNPEALEAIGLLSRIARHFLVEATLSELKESSGDVLQELSANIISRRQELLTALKELGK